MKQNMRMRPTHPIRMCERSRAAEWYNNCSRDSGGVIECAAGIRSKTYLCVGWADRIRPVRCPGSGSMCPRSRAESAWAIGWASPEGEPFRGPVAAAQ